MVIYEAMYSSAVLRVSSYSCSACRGGAAAEEHSGSNNVVLLRRGVFCRHIGKHTVTSDVNQASFFSKGSSYRVSHPADCGDRGTIFALAPDVLSDMLREFSPGVAEQLDQRFPFVTGPCDAGAFGRHRLLVTVLESTRGHPTDSLWVDETALELVSDVLNAAFRHIDLPSRRHRQRTVDDHVDLGEAAKAYVATRLGERVTLDGLASELHTSPFHLARVFRRRTGTSVHRYLVGLRLRTSLERLADGADDLTALALDLGFSSHSHFTDTFRRAFGRSPSDMRRTLTRSSLRELSRDLEV